jgi:hypothetical protein
MNPKHNKRMRSFADRPQLTKKADIEPALKLGHFEVSGSQFIF